MSEWQPIETAPTDGQWLVVAWFVNGHMRWWHRARFYRGDWRTGSGVVGPSHWLPFPELEPKEQK